MTDKEKDNVIIGPWSAHGKVNDEEAADWVKRKYQKALEKNNSQLKMQEKLLKIDTVTEGIMVQMIHTLSEQGYDIGSDDFLLDIGFLSEVIKSALHRQEELPHVIQGLIDNLMHPDKVRNEDGIEMHYSKFDSGLLGELVDMADDVREDLDGKEDELDIEFEPDTDLEPVTNWRKLKLEREAELKKKKEKEKNKTLHQARSDKMFNKDDEDKDED